MVEACNDDDPLGGKDGASSTKPFCPSLLSRSVDISSPGNFPQGCSFSPDGLCVLTSTAFDHQLRLYNTPPPSIDTVNDIETSTSISASVSPPIVSDAGDPSSPMSASASASASCVLDWKTALAADGCDSVRSYGWYPHMNSADPASCCFLSSSRGQPVHLVDAYTSKIRASYRPYNALDEMESPTVVTFSPDGQRIVTAGFRTDRTIHVFDIANPGRDSTQLRLGSTRRSTDGQKGLVSALTFSPPQIGFNNVFALGTYAPGSIYLYDDRMSAAASTILNGVCLVGHGKSHSRKKRRFAAVQVQDDNCEHEEDDVGSFFSAAKVRWFQGRAQGGVTQLSFSPSQDFILYSASRRSDAVLAWDVRMTSGNSNYASVPISGISSFATDSSTNQRLEFDFDETGERLFVGGRDKCVRVYDGRGSGKLIGKIDGLTDAANGISYSYSAHHGCGLLAVAVGARRFATVDDSDDDDDDNKSGDHNGTAVLTSDSYRDDNTPPGSLELYKV